jgi:hypothetical protein
MITLYAQQKGVANNEKLKLSSQFFHYTPLSSYLQSTASFKLHVKNRLHTRVPFEVKKNRNGHLEGWPSGKVRVWLGGRAGTNSVTSVKIFLHEQRRLFGSSFILCKEEKDEALLRKKGEHLFE